MFNVTQGSFILFILCIVFTVVGLFLLSDTYKKKYVVVYLLICSLLGCLTVMCVKVSPLFPSPPPSFRSLFRPDKTTHQGKTALC